MSRQPARQDSPFAHHQPWKRRDRPWPQQHTRTARSWSTLSNSFWYSSNSSRACLHMKIFAQVGKATAHATVASVRNRPLRGNTQIVSARFVKACSCLLACSTRQCPSIRDGPSIRQYRVTRLRRLLRSSLLGVAALIGTRGVHLNALSISSGAPQVPLRTTVSPVCRMGSQGTRWCSPTSGTWQLNSRKVPFLIC